MDVDRDVFRNEPSPEAANGPGGQRLPDLEQLGGVSLLDVVRHERDVHRLRRRRRRFERDDVVAARARARELQQVDALGAQDRRRQLCAFEDPAVERASDDEGDVRRARDAEADFPVFNKPHVDFQRLFDIRKRRGVVRVAADDVTERKKVRPIQKTLGAQMVALHDVRPQVREARRAREQRRRVASLVVERGWPGLGVDERRQAPAVHGEDPNSSVLPAQLERALWFEVVELARNVLHRQPLRDIRRVRTKAEARCKSRADDEQPVLHGLPAPRLGARASRARVRRQRRRGLGR
mmetsp:Transcript_12970/g.44879  ORF Transcript_12970/g.44879 Transcript_12970/m.44879 type:complete len:295 (-) Transcript_12970:1944-2828(-)